MFPLYAKKSGNVINVMNRLGSLLDRDCKMRIYDCFFLSNFNYCPLIYSMQNRINDKQIETLNKRMLRIVCNDRISSYNELLSTVNRPMLYCNRKKALID